MYKQGVFYLQ